MNTIQLLTNLPIDLRNKILSLTYKKQDNDLLKDITHNYESKLYIKRLYNNYWCIEPDEPFMEWLVNDIIIFLNNNKPTMFYLTNKYRDIVTRNIHIGTEDAIAFIERTDFLNINTQFTIYWSLLQIHERETILKTSIDKIN